MKINPIIISIRLIDFDNKTNGNIKKENEEIKIAENHNANTKLCIKNIVPLNNIKFIISISPTTHPKKAPNDAFLLLSARQVGTTGIA